MDTRTERPDAAAACCPPLAAAVDASAAEDLAAMLKALADPVRVRLVALAAAAPDGEVCACDLPAAVQRSQSTVSHHLSHLVAAGLLEREQRGKWAWFRVDRAVLATLTASLASVSGAPDGP